MLTAVSKIDAVVQFITVLVIFIGVLALAAFLTKWIAKYQNIKISNRNIQVIETERIAPNKYVQIVKIGSKYVAVAITKEHVTMLSELNEDELEFKEDLPDEKLSFQSFLDMAKKRSSESKNNPKEESK